MTSYPDCGMAYRLQRVDGVAETPALWNAAGTAFHECIREWEESIFALDGKDEPPSADDQAERFRHHLAEQIAKTVLETGVNFSAWRVARGGKEDRTWWLDNAPAWVANYVTAALARESVIHDIAGVPGMEVEFMWSPGRRSGWGYSLPEVKGFIDQVHRFPNGDILIRDLKSGSSRPVDMIQLKVYRLALEDEFGVTAPNWWGDFWMARQGRAVGDYYTGKTLNLTERGPIEEEVYNRLAIMDGAERAGFYLPKPSTSCTSCGVRAACPVMGDPATRRPWSVRTS